MGRPRKHPNDAARQAAHRARTAAEWVEVPRAAHEALNARLDTLQAAIYHAAKRGDETAQACSAANMDTMLDRLTIWFEARASGGADDEQQA